MSRRSSKQNRQFDTGRDISAISNRARLPRYILRRSVLSDAPTRLHLGADRRVFTPTPFATRTNSGRPTRLVIAKPGATVSKPVSQRPSWKAWHGVAFAVPERVAVCVRRKIRSEVLHALGVAGKRGVGRGGTARRGPFSDVGC